MLPKFLKKLFTQRKIALFLVFSFLFLVIFPKPLLAYSSGESFGSTFFSFENAVFRTNEMNLQSFVWETIKATTISLVEIITVCVTCPRDQGNTSGLIPIITGMIASIYANPPASGVEYLAYMGQKADLIPEAYAQGGVGFKEMSPYLPIWAAFRNIAYFLFVIIFVVIGFAIMFRIKISPQAVVTIESALPKLIIALLLITFSYTIVGFLVDIMMVMSNLVIFTFKYNVAGIPPFLLDRLTSTSITDTRQLLQTILAVGIPPILMAFIIFMLLGGIGAVLGAATLGIGSFVAIGLGLAALIFAVVFLIALIRLLWALIKAYVMVVLGLIFSPFIILVGALPGSNVLSTWFRSLLANLAVLPTILIMTFLSGYLTVTAFWRIPNMGPLVEGYITGTGDPLTQIQGMQNIIAQPDTASQLSTIFVLFLVSLAILLLTPKAAEIIQSFLSGKPFAYGAAIMEPLQTAWQSPIGGVVKKRLGETAEQRGPKVGGLRGEFLTGFGQWSREQKWIK